MRVLHSVQIGLVALLAGVLGYFVTGAIIYRGLSGKLVASRVATRMLADPVPIVVGLLCAVVAIFLMRK